MVLGDRYRLTGPIASGGMAQVWAAVDEVLDRDVAAKILHPHLGADDKFVTRFRREAVAAASLSHPSIVSIYDTISQDGLEAIVMELIDGRTLRAMIDERGALPGIDVAHYGSRIASALDVAHAAGIVHRDIKPANIMVCDDRRVLVTDFGIAKAIDDSDLTQTGMLLGTAKYLAPEQVTGAPIDPRSDLYALGVVLFESLTGTVPFRANTDAATALARLQKDPPPVRSIRPNVDPELDAIVNRLMARRPEDRYARARTVAAALDRLDPTATDATGSTGTASRSTQRIDDGADFLAGAPPPSGPLRSPAGADDDRVGRPGPERHAIGDASDGPGRHDSDDRWAEPARPDLREPPGDLGRFVGGPATTGEGIPPTSYLDVPDPSGRGRRSAGAEPIAPPPPGHSARHHGSPSGTGSEADLVDIGSGRLVRSATSRLGSLLVVGAVVAAVVVAGIAFTDIDTRMGFGDDVVTNPLVEAGPGLDIVTATSFDPQTSDATKEENEQLAPLAIDDDPGTAWRTENYRLPELSGLKDGVGLVLELEQRLPLNRIELDTGSTGWRAEIYVADSFAPDGADWGEPAAVIEAGSNRVVRELGRREGSRVLLWIRDTGTTGGINRFELFEAVVR